MLREVTPLRATVWFATLAAAKVTVTVFAEWRQWNAGGWSGDLRVANDHEWSAAGIENDFRDAGVRPGNEK
jgi:hypothetical protein